MRCFKEDWSQGCGCFVVAVVVVVIVVVADAVVVNAEFLFYFPPPLLWPGWLFFFGVFCFRVVISLECP